MDEMMVECRVCGLQKGYEAFYKTNGVITNRTCKECRRRQYLEKSADKVMRRNLKDGMCSNCLVNKAVYGSYCKICNRELSLIRMKKKGCT